MKTYEVTLTVQVSIPVSLEFDKQPTMGQLRRAALQNFMDHPALHSSDDLDMYVDSIGNGELDLTGAEIE